MKNIEKPQISADRLYDSFTIYVYNGVYILVYLMEMYIRMKMSNAAFQTPVQSQFTSCKSIKTWF